MVFEDDYELAIMCKNRGIKPVRISRTDKNNDVLCFLRELQDKIGSLREREDADLLNAYSTIITDSFSGLIPKLPPKILNLNVLQEDGSELVVTRNEKEVEEGKILLFTQLFEQWIEPTRGGPGRKIAIVASPGVGKTVLLSLFAKWLRDAPEFPIKPVVLFLTAASLEDIEINKTELMNRIHENIKRPKSSPYSPEAIQGKFEELREKGLVYLLFDGLDEFGAGRPGELKNLMTCLRKLAENMHVNILITCRKVFWRSQVAKENIEEEVWTKIQIKSIAEKRMNTLLPDPPFGDFAYNDGDKRKGLRLGFRNYLIWSFVEELGGPVCGQEFGSRWQLFGDWSQRQAQEAQEETGIRSDDWMAFFQETALELLRKEEPSVYPPKLKDGLVLPFEQCCKTRIVRPSGDRENRKIRFFQESVKEFFTANALADSFCKLLEGICKGEAFDDLPLAEVDQDFLQPSIYGFLYEILSEKHGEDHIVSIIKNLKICVLKKLNKRLLRNVVEYIGMTYRQRGSVDPDSEKENYESIVYWLLDIVGEPELVDQCASEPDHDYVRYNAARALERIHPWAPHPYFDYMSDWGDRDWGDIHKEASNEGLRPWAIRWRGSTYPESPERSRTPGQRPSLAICKNSKINLCLQECVSYRLIDDICRLLKKPEKNYYLLINCSYALVRWYIEDHSEKLAKLRSKAGELFETRAQNPVYDNVVNWVGRSQFSVKT